MLNILDKNYKQCGNGYLAKANGYKANGGKIETKPINNIEDVNNAVNANGDDDDYFAKVVPYSPLLQSQLEEASKEAIQLGGMSKKDARESVKSIRDFTGKNYEAIRELQYAGKTSPEIEKINKYIEKMPKQDGKIYRGKSFNDEKELVAFMKSMKEGKPYELPAISSFSSDKVTAQNFATNSNSPKLGKVPLVFVVKSNKKGVSVSHVSKFKGEAEVLVPKGVQYQMNGKPYKEGDTWYIPVKEK